MIDIHSHLLPGVDDGAENLAEALDMARVAAADGITRIVLSPHVYDGRLGYGQDLAGLAERVRELSEAMKRQGIPLELDFWGEIWLTPEVLDEIDRLPTIRTTAAGESRYALFEFGLNEAPRQLEEYFFRLLAQDITPVIAHPERVHAVIEDPEVAAGWVEQGCLLQVNAGSLTGLFGRRARETAFALLTSGVVHFLGTDAHSPTGRRPEFSGALAVAADLVGEESARRLVTENPRALLAGAKIEAVRPQGAGQRARPGLLPHAVGETGRNHSGVMSRLLERLQNGWESRRNRRGDAAR